MATVQGSSRFARQESFFGCEGQAKIRAIKTAIVGVGGLGTHVVQQLALLGVRDFVLIDPEEVDDTNRNRYVGLLETDPIPGTRKVDIGERIVVGIDKDARAKRIATSFVTEDGFAAIRGSDFVFGCLDKEGLRLILSELCTAYARPYFDLASEIFAESEPPVYGGRVCFADESAGCLVCYGELDQDEAERDLSGEDGRRQRRLIYGIDHEALDRTGPSVVSINGVIASLAVTEFMAHVTGLRPAKGLLTYRGHLSKVLTLHPESERPMPACYYCAHWGLAEVLDPDRYLRVHINL